MSASGREQIPELQPCPFCGSTKANIHKGSGVAWCVCGACGCTMPLNRTERQAIAAWNTRVPTTELREGQMHLAMELERKDEQIRKLRDALWEIGAMPNGFCCCPAFRDPDKESHCGECTMARAALKEGE